jgi:catalase
MTQTSDADLAAQLVAGLRSVFGRHPARAAHAKGIVLEGHFTPTAEARALSAAALFAGPAVAITVRFSDFAGLPDIPDTDDNATPHGMAVRFHVGSGGDFDIVVHSFNGFPTATAAEFGELVQALAASGPGAAKPTALETFLASHPIAATFLTTQKPPPVSFATIAYFGVNTVLFIDAAGRRTPVRHRFVPTAGEHHLDAAMRITKGPNYLREEIAQRVGDGAATFDWQVQIAEAGDQLDNPAVAWPESRRRASVGTIAVERVTADQAAADKILFGPGFFPPGIEGADPMLAIRNAAYLVSSKERS